MSVFVFYCSHRFKNGLTFRIYLCRLMKCSKYTHDGIISIDYINRLIFMKKFNLLVCIFLRYGHTCARLQNLLSKLASSFRINELNAT